MLHICTVHNLRCITASTTIMIIIVDDYHTLQNNLLIQNDLLIQAPTCLTSVRFVAIVPLRNHFFLGNAEN